MVFDISEVEGIGEYREGGVYEKLDLVELIYMIPDTEKVFLIVNLKNGEQKTVEVRCDNNLSRELQEKYESVMESRYFGRGGVEVVLSGQLPMSEINDLVRLSYNLTK